MKEQDLTDVENKTEDFLGLHCYPFVRIYNEGRQKLSGSHEHFEKNGLAGSYSNSKFMVKKVKVLSKQIIMTVIHQSNIFLRTTSQN